MISTVIAVLIFLFTAQSPAQPILGADPCGSKSEFYIITINGEEKEPIPALEKYDWILFSDVAKLNLPDGFHEVMIRTCTEGDESDDLMFFIEVDTYGGFRRYEIVPDPENIDPAYLSKFNWDAMVADVFDNGDVIVGPKEPDGNGDSGEGCFIDSLRFSN